MNNNIVSIGVEFLSTNVSKPIASYDTTINCEVIGVTGDVRTGRENFIIILFSDLAVINP